MLYRAALSPTLRALRTCTVLLSYYCVSASIILITKWVMSDEAPSTAPTHPSAPVFFPFPLTITTCSNTVVTAWAYLFSRHSALTPAPLTSAQFKSYVLPIGIITALEIGASNFALLLLTVSFGTILKGGAPVFTLLWGVALGLESFTVPLSLAITLIAGGITLASVGEGADFALLGFVLQLSATALGGLRWAMTHKLLKGEPGSTMPPLTATLYTSPTTAFCVLPFALVLESGKVFRHFASLDKADAARLAGILFIIASLVFLVLISEYWLVNDTSSLALSVAGVFKECMTIGGGILIFKDTFTLMNSIGFVVCQVGIACYVVIRYDSSGDGDGGTGGAGDLPTSAHEYQVVDSEGTDDEDDFNTGGRRDSHALHEMVTYNDGIGRQQADVAIHAVVR